MSANETYDAFISYSHRTGGALGPALRDALHDFGRPWYRLRYVRVFCDRSSIAPNESLWGAIEKALHGSSTFILLASPESARSHWVQRELTAWQAQSPRRPILIVLTEGDIVWDGDAGDFRWDVTTALPRCLKGWFVDEPLWVDMRPVVAAATQNTRHRFSTADPLFLDAVATIAAAVARRPKDELIGADIQKFRGARRFRRLSWTGLSLLTVTAVIAAVLAGIRSAEAVRQTEVATGQRLVAQADSTRADQARASLEYGVAAAATDRTHDARTAIQRTLTQTHYAGTIQSRDDTATQIVCVTPDGRTIISLKADGRVTFSDVLTHTEVGELPPRERPVLNAAFDARRHHLYVIDKKRVTTWDITDLHHPQVLVEYPLTVDDPTFESVAVGDRSGTVLLAVGDGLSGLDLWSISASGEPTLVTKIDAKTGHPEISMITAMTFTSDGSMLVLGGEDDIATFWTLGSTGALYAGKMAFDSGYTGMNPGIHAIDVNLDRHLLALGAGDRVGLLDIIDPSQPKLVGRLGPIGFVEAIAISADGRSLVAGGDDDRATVWDIGTIENPIQTALQGHADIVNSVAFSPDGQVIATGSDDGTTVLWHRYSISEPAATGTFRTHQETSNVAAFGLDGQLLAIGGADSSIELWSVVNVAKPELIRRFYVPLLPEGQAASVRAGTVGVADLVFSPDGRFLAAGGSGMPSGFGGIVNLFDVRDPGGPRYLTTIGDNAHTVDRVAFGADGRLLATADGGGEIVLWELTDPTRPSLLSKFRVPNSGIIAIRFDGRALWVIGQGEKEVVTVWDTTDPIHPAQRAAFGSEEDASTTIAASGNHLIATGGTNKDISLWDATDLTQPQRLAGIDGHRGGAITVDFDPRGEMLATSGADRTLKIWDVSAPATPVQLAAIPLGGVDPMRVLFDPGQPQLFVLDGTGTVRFWDTTAIDAVIRDPIHVACAVLAPGPVPAEWSGKLDARTAASAC